MIPTAELKIAYRWCIVAYHSVLLLLILFFLVAFIGTPFSCPVEVGICLDINGEDQNSGVIKLDNINGDTHAAQQACLEKCRNTAGATGCEVVRDYGEWSGCYAHTAELSQHGDGMDKSLCWVLSKCQGKEKETHLQWSLYIVPF